MSALSNQVALALFSVLLVGTQATASQAKSGYGAPAAPSYGDPTASYQVPDGIGHWKAVQDRSELRRYDNDPAAQAILRQQRHNLCRNVPEVC